MSVYKQVVRHYKRIINTLPKILSVRENPSIKNKAIEYFQKCWPSVLPIIYEDSINHCVDARNSLPQWYLLEMGDKLIGCAGLITNDFISRGDLYPWLCALFIDKQFRGNSYGSLLIDKIKLDTKRFGYNFLYLCTSHVGYYEKHDFSYLGQGYHPWGEESRIYEIELH